MGISSEIFALLGTLAAAILGYLGVKATARSNVKAKEIESDKPDWAGFTDRITERLDAQQVELKNQADQIISLRSRVETLQETIESTRRKYWAAIGGIRRIASRDKTALDTARLPPDVQEDVLNG